MPTLNQRNDGGFYIRANPSGQGFITYQVTYEALIELQRARLGPGDKIPHDLFFELKELDYIYTEGGFINTRYRVEPEQLARYWELLKIGREATPVRKRPPAKQQST